MLPTSVKYYLGESLRHIIPCLGTFRHNCILKAILARKLAFIIICAAFSVLPLECHLCHLRQSDGNSIANDCSVASLASVRLCLLQKPSSQIFSLFDYFAAGMSLHANSQCLTVNVKFLQRITHLRTGRMRTV